ncbi:MAG: MucR family transcriptional regulator [Alphaproteobacteria bacterium]|nr:MucR family transcriptional regulator [Alphaproteobacteria bacterium]
MSDRGNQGDLLALTAEIVSAHVANNAMPVSELAHLIREVYIALSNAGTAATVEDRPQSAVPIKKSVTADYIVCLEDGKKLKMLKRHLRTAYDMSPEEYRERWQLPSDYPMVAPSYARHRSSLAKKIGLGTKARKMQPEAE